MYYFALTKGNAAFKLRKNITVFSFIYSLVQSFYYLFQWFLKNTAWISFYLINSVRTQLNNTLVVLGLPVYDNRILEQYGYRNKKNHCRQIGVDSSYKGQYKRSYTREWLKSSTKESYWKGLKKIDRDIVNTCITISPLIILPFLRCKCIYLIVNFYGTGNLHLKLISLQEITISISAVCFHC